MLVLEALESFHFMALPTARCSDDLWPCFEDQVLGSTVIALPLPLVLVAGF